MKILVTGANGDIGEAVGRILQEEFPNADISGADAAGQWPGGFVFRNMRQIPLASAPEYLNHIHRLADQFDLIIPTSEAELARLSQVNDIKSQLPLLMVSPEILNIFMDKYETVLLFEKHDLNPPKTKLFAEVATADLPIYIKPRRGWGSRGHRLVTTDSELHVAKQVVSDDWIAQEYLPGRDNEYTCALSRLGGNVKYIVLRRQLQGGNTSKAEVVDIPEINVLLKDIADIFTFDGCINVQLKLTNDGPKVFEVNPRLSSTVMMRHRLGFRDCEWWVRSFLGMPLGESSAPTVGAVVYRMSTECVVPE